MPDNSTISEYNYFNELKKAVETQRTDVLRKKEQYNRILRYDIDLNRYFREGNDKHIALKNDLKNQLNTVEKDLLDAQNSLQDLEKELASEWNKVLKDTDPKLNLNKLNSSYPVLMMPLRIETRFIKSKDAENELWIRVFPDDCSIDTFEEILSESEVENAQNYWIDMLIAGDNDDGKRAAWRSLVANHGAGRAQYIIGKYNNTVYNAEEIWSQTEGSNDDKVVLSINFKTENIGEDDKHQLANYWIEVWRANDDATRIKQAYTNFNTEGGEDYKKYLINNFVPKNINTVFSKIENRDDVTVLMYLVKFSKDYENIHGIKQNSWTKAPRVNTLPECFRIIGYRNNIEKLNIKGELLPMTLICGPNPQAKKEDLDKNDLKITPEMKWMVDFQEAISNGMGFIIKDKDDYDHNIYLGYDRLMVVGVKLSADKYSSKDMIQNLFINHYNSYSGFSFLKVGTPTNNVREETESGYTESENPDESYNQMYIPELDSLIPDANSWYSNSDRYWFNKLLGFDNNFLQDTINTDGFDQREARAMNIALWPATWGYFFDTMMRPVFNDVQIECLKKYFNGVVSGRGIIPSIRIGSQPYGILPTTVFSRINWFNSKVTSYLNENIKIPSSFYEELYSKLLIIQKHWKNIASAVPHIRMNGDSHQILLDILGQHGGSVEFYNRYTQGLNHLWNLFMLSNEEYKTGDKLYQNQLNSIKDILKSKRNTSAAINLLKELGYTSEQIPEILEKYFLHKSPELNILIDDKPLSESSPIRTYTEKEVEGNKEEQNYIEWLIEATKTSLNSIVNQDGLKEKPQVLLYLMLRHALQLGYFTTSIELFKNKEYITDEMWPYIWSEPDFIHIRGKNNTNTNPSSFGLSNKTIDNPLLSESRYFLLHQKISDITGDANKTVAEYISGLLKGNAAKGYYIQDQLFALEHLKKVSTASLERLFAEHIDCATYRFDAWKWGLINTQLLALREKDLSVNPHFYGGLYIGAYGWLENVRSENKNLTELSTLENDDLNSYFKPNEGAPIVKDNKNLGYIQTPSLNHAVTASILRNAYLSRASTDAPNLYNINISSERVRKALSVIEGMQAGQNLAALLGYQFERYIHDNNPGNVDQYIYPLRRQFPLVSDQLASTHSDEKDYTDKPIESLEARNVVNASDLIAFVEAHLGPNGEPDYYKDLKLGNTTGDSDVKSIITKAIDYIRDTNDAVADLGIAESVHQVVQGNIDRAAGTLETYSKGNYPQMPDVIQTPRKGVNLTHRFGLHLNPEVQSKNDDNPRGKAEPGLNEWLENILPLPANIIVYVKIANPDLNLSIDNFCINMQNIGLQPIDLLYELNTETDQAMTSLDDKIVRWIMEKFWIVENQEKKLRPDTAITINYHVKQKSKDDLDKVSVFEVMPLIKHLRAILLRSRPLRPNDIALSNESKKQTDSNLFFDACRIKSIHDYILSIKGEAEEFNTIGELDDVITKCINILQKLSLTGIPQAGFGFIYDWQKQQLNILLGKVREVLTRWDKKIIDYKDAIKNYENAADIEKLKYLMNAERAISTQLTLKPVLATFSDIVMVKFENFKSKKDELSNFLKFNHASLREAINYINNKGIFSYSEFDLLSTEIDDIENACQIFTNDISVKVNLLAKDLQKRIDKCKELMQGYSLPDQNQIEPFYIIPVNILQDVAKQLLSEDFVIVPSFSMLENNFFELSKALSKTDDLLEYQKTIKGNPLPVDDWFHGMARVREKMEHFEQVIFWAEGFNDIRIELTPVQLPYKEPYRWLALEFFDPKENPDLYPDKDTPDNQYRDLMKIFHETDHLLYTSYNQQSFDPASIAKCGLLVDEWTETIPLETETTGTAFHYDRPNSEPPQTMLLVMSPQINENWKWQDLVDAIYETLDEAKLRGVEPKQLDDTGFAAFLPATNSSVTKKPTTISVNYTQSSLLYKTNK